MRNFLICTPYQILFAWSNREEMGGSCSTYGGEEWYNRVLVGNL